MIDLQGSTTPVDVQQEGSKVVVRFPGIKIPTHLARRLNTTEFATPVASIDAFNNGSNGVVSIQSTGSYEYMAYQAENKLTISLKRPQDNVRLNSKTTKTIRVRRSHWIFKTLKYAAYYSYWPILPISIW